MNRIWTLALLLITVGCSAKPAKVPDERSEVGTIAPAATSEEPTPAVEPTPMFDPITTTPVTTATEEPKFPEQPAGPKVELTAEIKQAIANLVHDDAKVKEQAQLALEKLDNKTVDTLLAAAQDTSADVRAGAMYGLLGNFNQFNQQMMATLVEGLGDSNARVRGFAVVAAGDMPPESLEPALNKLASILANSSEPPHVRAAAARLLSKLSSGAFGPLQKGLLEDKDRGVRLACMKGIIETAPSPSDAKMALSKALSDTSDVPLRRAAALRLGELGEAAAGAVPSLIAALGDSDARVANAAAAALVRIGSPSVALLTETAESGEKPVRLLALQALFQLGPVASASQSQLEKLAQDPDAEIQSAAAAALQAVSQK